MFDLDTLKPAGAIAKARARGVAVDPKSHHGFCSSSPVVMWDTRTLETLKTIDVQGCPDGILFEPATERVYVFSHSQPNATVINSKEGGIVGTIDLGGAPEQAASDGQGRLYVAIEDKDQVAVVDLKTLKVTAHYDLGGKGGGPGGLALDAKNQILFAFCHDPATAVILSAKDGSILATLPIGRGTDGGGFNPNTMEALVSQGDGTLTFIKGEQPKQLRSGTNGADEVTGEDLHVGTKSNRILLIATEPAPARVGRHRPRREAPTNAAEAEAVPRAGQVCLIYLVVGRGNNGGDKGGASAFVAQALSLRIIRLLNPGSRWDAAYARPRRWRRCLRASGIWVSSPVRGWLLRRRPRAGAGRPDGAASRRREWPCR